ncbi:hypothetical protein CHL76_09490 [Marinococcus halophilus]|uniref:Uncharacterized protein n=1 Tax=Marinococcus halophilus TaxID=1371 RepID=A0A510Y486_MARHA|nr:hypothetical protein [Marinococcus halophilus]OZT79929.1 hypothetical protein CHL76_09490 [Marinococcus halophilus]GEK58155.1 hypothetical protein MHA01_10600 [Marinococcus halophilus]
MNEIELLSKSLTKSEAVQICKYFSIHAQGFTFNIEKAPEPMLISAIRNELNKAGKKKGKRGKKHTSIGDIYEFFIKSDIDKVETIKKMSFEDFCFQIEVHPWQTSKATIISILRKEYAEIYNQYYSQLLHNIENNKFILEGIINETSSREKLELIRENLQSDLKIERLLKSLKEQLVKELGKEKVERMSRNVAMSEDNLAKELIEARVSEKYIPLTMYLLENENYKLAENNLYLIHVIIIYFTQLEEKHKNELQDKQRNIYEYEKEVKEYQILKENYAKIKKENDYLQDKIEYLENEKRQLTSQLQNEQQEKKRLDQQRQNYYQIILLIQEKLQFENVLIVTNDDIFDQFEWFKKRTVSIDDFSKHLRQDNIMFFQEHCFCITRVSYESTEKWRRHENYLKQKEINFVELSGFNFMDYLDQIIEFIYQKEQIIL